MSIISDAIQDKCLAFSDRIIRLNDYLLEQAASKRYDGGSQRADRRNKTQTSYVRHQTSRVPVHLQSVAALANQLLRSGTSIGANIHEAQYAQGTKDFISKLEIALKECYESEYWLELLHETGFLTDEAYQPLRTDCGAIRRMLIASVTTVKKNNEQ
jgi:four helix bundle protein